MVFRLEINVENWMCRWLGKQIKLKESKMFSWLSSWTDRDNREIEGKQRSSKRWLWLEFWEFCRERRERKKLSIRHFNTISFFWGERTVSCWCVTNKDSDDLTCEGVGRGLFESFVESGCRFFFREKFSDYNYVEVDIWLDWDHNYSQWWLRRKRFCFFRLVTDQNHRLFFRWQQQWKLSMKTRKVSGRSQSNA